MAALRRCRLCDKPVERYKQLCEEHRQFMVDDRKDTVLKAARICPRCFRPWPEWRKGHACPECEGKNSQK